MPQRTLPHRQRPQTTQLAVLSLEAFQGLPVEQPVVVTPNLILDSRQTTSGNIHNNFALAARDCTYVIAVWIAVAGFQRRQGRLSLLVSVTCQLSCMTAIYSAVRMETVVKNSTRKSSRWTYRSKANTRTFFQQGSSIQTSKPLTAASCPREDLTTAAPRRWDLCH